jgi:hypothetical protein
MDLDLSKMTYNLERMEYYCVVASCVVAPLAQPTP